MYKKVHIRLFLLNVKKDNLYFVITMYMYFFVHKHYTIIEIESINAQVFTLIVMYDRNTMCAVKSCNCSKCSKTETIHERYSHRKMQ